jgi:hypothetical protein
MDFWPWLIGIVVAVAAYALWFLWKSRTHPAQILLRQAASMNWVAASMAKFFQRNQRQVALMSQSNSTLLKV